jgi:hypothetical protein
MRGLSWRRLAENSRSPGPASAAGAGAPGQAQTSQRPGQVEQQHRRRQRGQGPAPGGRCPDPPKVDDPAATRNHGGAPIGRGARPPLPIPCQIPVCRGASKAATPRRWLWLRLAIAMGTLVAVALGVAYARSRPPGPVFADEFDGWRVDTGGRLPYRSGTIASHRSFARRYGDFELRAKLPRGQGLWPAF